MNFMAPETQGNPAEKTNTMTHGTKDGSSPKSGAKRATKEKGIILVLVILLLAASALGVYKLFFVEEERVAITGKTTFGALNEAIEGSGTTTPADSVSYDVSGKVLEWYVQPGDDVEAGDLLYVLDSSDAEDEILENEVELEKLYEQLQRSASLSD